MSPGICTWITLAQTIDVRYPPAKFVLPLGALIALAIIDLGPRANAAYLPVSSPPTVRNDLGMADADDAPAQKVEYQPRVELGSLLHQLPGGSTTTTPPSQQGGDGPSASLTQVIDSPAPALVTYLREPSGSLDLFHFIAAILDPPRTV